MTPLAELKKSEAFAKLSDAERLRVESHWTSATKIEPLTEETLRSWLRNKSQPFNASGDRDAPRSALIDKIGSLQRALERKAGPAQAGASGTSEALDVALETLRIVLNLRRDERRRQHQLSNDGRGDNET